MKRLGEKAPKSANELGSLRLRLVQAGYRREEALTIFFGIRIAFAFALFALFASSIVFKPNLALALGGLGLGYILPGMVLARLAKRRAHRIRLSLADMLDLLVVSVEAGLGLDQALQRVGQELAFAYPELADELRLINLELRAGKPRSEALRNLADRTGVDDLSSLVTMLIQTDKFGTSVAQSLRVYSETLADQASAARRRSGGEDGRQDGLPARALHLPGDLGRHDRPGRHPLRHRALPDDRGHEVKRLIARNTSTGAIVADRVGVAATRADRAVGLLSRSGLNPGEALWIVPSRGVHTCGMRFPIDVIALDGSGVVIDCVSELKPWRIRLPRRGTAGVLELEAGRARRLRHDHRSSDSLRSLGRNRSALDQAPGDGRMSATVAVLDALQRTGWHPHRRRHRRPWRRRASTPIRSRS